MYLAVYFVPWIYSFPFLVLIVFLPLLFDDAMLLSASSYFLAPLFLMLLQQHLPLHQQLPQLLLSSSSPLLHQLFFFLFAVVHSTVVSSFPSPLPKPVHLFSLSPVLFFFFRLSDCVPPFFFFLPLPFLAFFVLPLRRYTLVLIFMNH